jgi:hypothetical protein
VRRLLLAALTLLACPAVAAAEVRLQKVGGFDSPVYLTAAPGDFSRLYVVEKEGTVRVHRGGQTLPTPFIDLTPGELTAVGERGLLSLAFRPDFQTSRLLYIYYTDAEGDVRIDELRARDPDRVDSDYRRKVLEIPHPDAANHNGGTITFGPDGHLYVGPGDGGRGKAANAQDKESLLGKVLRIRPTPGGGYSVPGDNPLVGQPGRDEIWSLGLRNPYRFTVDPVSGDLAIGDVGEATTEELNYVPRAQGGGRGANFGWNRCEGSFLTGNTTAVCDLGVLPVVDHAQSAGWRSIIAGYVVRDASLPSLAGRLVYGDFSLGQLWSARPATPKASDARRLLDLPGVSSLSLDAGGCLYATSLHGPVYRIVERATEIPCPAPPSAGGLGGGGGGGGGGGVRPGGSGAPAPDTARPRIRTRVSPRQGVLEQRGVTAFARCNEACRVSMSATVRIGRRTFELRKVTVAVRANRRVKLRVVLTKRAAKALRGARGKRRRAYVKVALRARDRSRNRSRLVRATVRVRR